MLHKLVSHPIFAGVYARGRTQSFVDYVDGKLVKRSRRREFLDGWKVCIKDHHEPYISWEQYQSNLAKLAEARPRWPMNDNRGAVREGPALLAGLVRCGHCGRKIRVTYNHKSSAMYYCDGDGPRGERRCLSFGAGYVDEQVGEQLCRVVEPLAIEAAERAFALDQQEHEGAVEQARLRVQSAQYAADRAFEQYDLADPKNRLVVDNLEQRLNDKLAEVRAAREDLERRSREDPPLTEEQRDEIHRLAGTSHGLGASRHPHHLAQAAPARRDPRDRRQPRRREPAAGDHDPLGRRCVHELAVSKRATPVGSKADSSLTELVRDLALSLDDGEIARILNMKKMTTPRDLRWSQDRVRAFRSHHRIRKVTRQTSGCPHRPAGARVPGRRLQRPAGPDPPRCRAHPPGHRLRAVADPARRTGLRGGQDAGRRPQSPRAAPPRGGSPQGQGQLFPTK